MPETALRARSRMSGLGAALGACLVALSCKETVLLVVDVAAVEITGLSGPLALGAQQQLNARVRDDRGNTLAGRPVTWSSSNNNVASVDQTGRVSCIGAGSVTITVVAEGVNGTIVVDCHNPAPTLSALNPTNVLMQGATFTLTVTGTNFVPGAIVRWAGANRTTTFVNATTITASIPASDLTAPRYADITVVNPAPGGGASAARPFAVRINVSGPLLAAGQNHTCGILGFSAYCWGSNRSAQLGDGTTVDRLAPTAVTGNLSLVAVSAFFETTCGLDVIGLAYCWGSNNSGVRGAGTGTVSNLPNAVADGRQYRVLSTGLFHACAIDLNGAAWCWGENGSGQLGDGTNVGKNRPTAVAGGLTFVSISAGRDHTCGITTASLAYCWGFNLDSRLGDNTTTNRSSPIAVQTAATFVSVSVADFHTCARTSTALVYCWGRGGGGQLGNGANPAIAATPVLIPGYAASLLETGQDFSCGVSTANTVSCWGVGDYGQLGVGGTQNRNTPAQVSGLSSVRDVAAGERHACAMTTLNEMWCWGSKGRGQLGDGTNAIRPTPVQANNGTGFTQVQTGEEYSCGLRSSGRIACWGTGGNGQIGNGGTADALTPTDGTSSLMFAHLATGGAFACGIVSLTRAGYCWGTGSSGQLGNGTTSSAPTPVLISGNHQFVTLNAGNGHTCGVNSTAQLLCWGSGSLGQLGTGSTGTSLSPVVVAPPAGVTFNTVSAGYLHTCASTTTGAVYCWGYNFYGQLGDGSATNRSTPVPVPSLTGIVEVSAGYFHSCARNAAGNAWCWGFGGVGELGAGTTSQNTPVPVQVTGGLLFRSIAAGRQSTCGVTTAGQGYCWGLGSDAQLGTGSLAQANATPTQVGGGLTWSGIEPWLSHTCGVTSAGAVYCWGTLRSGELGIGLTGIETVPKRVLGGQFSPARLFVRRPR